VSVIWDKSLYDAAYESRSRGVIKHYERSVIFQGLQIRAALLVNVLGLDATDRVVIFGCGFGWLDEALRALGIDAVGTDPSAYIQSAWTDGTGETGSDKKPLDERGHNNGSRQAIRREFAGNNDPTHVVSEDVLTSLSDAEILDLAQWDSFTDAEIVHITHTIEDDPRGQAQAEFPLWNWKTMADWRAFFDGAGLGDHRLFRPGRLEEF
jgi:hypothetical protein